LRHTQGHRDDQHRTGKRSHHPYLLCCEEWGRLAPPTDQVKRAGRSVQNPVPIRDMQNPAFNPFQVDARFSLRRWAGSAEAVLPRVGNDRQRVVIEHVTVDASIPEGQRTVALAGIERSASAGSASFYFTGSGYLVDLP
jgi:hypothetical protein